MTYDWGSNRVQFELPRDKVEELGESVGIDLYLIDEGGLYSQWRVELELKFPEEEQG